MHADTDLVASLPALDGVRDEVVEWLGTHVERVTFEPGEQLVTEGHDDRPFWASKSLLCSGLLAENGKGQG